MRVLVLDISTSAGWAVLDGEPVKKPALQAHGTITLPQEVKEYGKYPWSYLKAAQVMADSLSKLIVKYSPDVVVVEETNLGKQRYSQKLLEFIHCSFLAEFDPRVVWDSTHGKRVDAPLVYLSTSEWRKVLDLRLSNEQRKQNTKVSRAKGKSRKPDGKLDLKKFNAEKKRLGVRGKTTWKHVAVQYVNDPETGYGLGLKQKDNDAADAICIGLAYFKGAVPCDGLKEEV